ncbi:hypothetical protein KFE25_009787, partial [Diacronema lutheri]
HSLSQSARDSRPVRTLEEHLNARRIESASRVRKCSGLGEVTPAFGDCGPQSVQGAQSPHAHACGSGGLDVDGMGGASVAAICAHRPPLAATAAAPPRSRGHGGCALVGTRRERLAPGQRLRFAARVRGVGGSGDGGSDGASACPPFSAQGARALATGGELTPELLRVDLTGVCAARSDELASRVRSRTQRSAAPDGADESGQARLYGEDMHSSLSADFLAMFAPSGTVVSTMEGE